MVPPPMVSEPRPHANRGCHRGDGEVESGPAYVVVRDVGLVRLDDAGSTLVVASEDTWPDPALAIDDAGVLWASGIDDSALLRVDGAHVERITLDRRSELRAERLAPGPDGRLWIATGDIEWTIGVFYGERFHAERSRPDFEVPGGYSDNKLEDLAATAEGVFIVTWNGLFRRTPDGEWTPLSRAMSSGPISARTTRPSSPLERSGSRL